MTYHILERRHNVIDMDRRDFLRLAGLGGVVFASSLVYGAQRAVSARKYDEFYFVQLSDTHWGFTGPEANPDAAGTLKKAVAAVNSLDTQPDFIVFTGDLTHTTDDSKERRKRMAEFRDIIGALKVKDIKLMPGEHDASLDRGEAFQEFFGKTHYTFDHKGVHFIVLDNVSDPGGRIGDEQLQWLGQELERYERDVPALGKEAPIVILTHRPLFDLYPQWDWATRDGSKAIELLLPYANVTVFYGHIHQEHHHMTGHIPHHAAKSLIFPLPSPGSVPKRVPVPWNAAEPYKGMGFRRIEAEVAKRAYALTEYPVLRG
jgi:calcineurin-like phosphoesterase family protein